MIETSLLKNLLLNVNPRVIGLSEYLNQVALLFIIPAFYMGMIAEYFTNFDFKSVAKRALIAFLAIKLLMPIHIQAVDASLNTSSALLSKYSSGNKFLTAYQSAHVATDSNKGIWERLKSIVAIVTDDPLVVGIFLFSYAAFFLLTQLYGLIYHLTLAFIGFCAVLSILPITSRSLTGAIYSSLWCVLMPFVIMIVLALVGDSDAFLKDYSGGIVQNVESLIQLLVMMVILLLTPLLTTKIMNGTGLNSVADNLGQMAAMTTMIGGSKYASKALANSALKFGGAAHSVSSKPLINHFKGNLSKKAGAIASKKDLGPSLSTLTDESLKGKLKGGIEDFKNDYPKTNWKEKAVLGADSIFNKKENQLAGIARKSEAESLKKNINQATNDPNFEGIKIDRSKLKMPISEYKEGARKFNQDQERNQERLIKNPNANTFLASRKFTAQQNANIEKSVAGRRPLSRVGQKASSLDLNQFKGAENKNGRTTTIQREPYREQDFIHK